MSQNTQPTYPDRLFGALMLILAISYGWLATQFQEMGFGPEEAVGPKTFPLIIAGILGVSGAWLIIKPQAGETWPSGKMWLELLFTVIVLIAFALLLEPLGFLPTAILCCGLISWRMGAKPLNAFLIAIVYCLGLYFLFDRLLDLALPAGILEGIL